MGRNINGGGEISSAVCSLLALMLVIGAVVVSVPSRSAAQIGCCYCDNCPVTVGPFCTDLMNSSASCVDLCIVQRGCAVLEFSPQETCDQGCGSKPPFFSPTPTATPTQTVTSTPTISPTPSVTPTPPDTPTPVFCCQGDSGSNRCGIANPSNQAMCLANETPVRDAACLAGQCRTFTPTFTQTNTPTQTNTRTSTPTPTSTHTATPTPTIFMGNLFNCDRITASKNSESKGEEFTVTDAKGQRTKLVLKPRYLCSPAVFGPGVPSDPHVFFTCYKTKDTPKIAGGAVTIRNAFDVALPVTVIKGDLLCIPSYQLPTVTPKPPLTPFTPTRTVTNTPGTAPTNTP